MIDADAIAVFLINVVRASVVDVHGKFLLIRTVLVVVVHNHNCAPGIAGR